MTLKSNHNHVMGMVAAIIERGDDQLVDGENRDAKWVISLLLGQLGYELHITEDGEVEIWPEGGNITMEPGDRPYAAAGYRVGEVGDTWYHTEESYRAAVREHNKLAATMDTLDRMSQ
jgi:hypothetical protein